MNIVATIILASAMVVWMVLYRIERKAHISCHDEACRLRRQLEIMQLERDSEAWQEVKSEYVVTESDMLRWKTPKEVYYEARKRIANNIGWSIVKAFQPEESLTDTGKTKYTYRFKIRK